MRARPAAKAALRGRSPEIMLALPQDARQPALRRSAWWVPVDLAKSTAPARVGEAQVRRRIGGGREGRLNQRGIKDPRGDVGVVDGFRL